MSQLDFRFKHFSTIPFIAFKLLHRDFAGNNIDGIKTIYYIKEGFILRIWKTSKDEGF